MNILTWIIGLIISVWVGAMAAGAVVRTKSAEAWFGDMLGQTPALMRINGVGLLIAVFLILFNLFFPERVSIIPVKWALVGIATAQLSTLFMQIRGGAPGAATIGPLVLIVLAIIYWFIRT